MKGKEERREKRRKVTGGRKWGVVDLGMGEFTLDGQGAGSDGFHDKYEGSQC